MPWTSTHRNSLCEIIEREVGKPGLGAEIGVGTGDTSLALLECFPSLTLVMVDPWVPGRRADVRSNFPQSRRLTYEKTDFARLRRIILEMTSEEAAKWMAPHCTILDFVFIDALHSYEMVQQDIRLWHPIVKEGGIVSGHDYGGRHPGVVQAVDEFVHLTSRELKLAPGAMWWYKK